MLPERVEVMNRADQRGGAGTGRERFEVVFPGEGHALRQALKEAVAFLHKLSLAPEVRGLVELVLAEVGNNVIKHAYCDAAQGVIEFRIEQRQDALRFVILDDGLPMAAGVAPPGRLPRIAAMRADLPEGGFGWHMIRALTRDLNYSRIGNRNRLEFTMWPAALIQGPEPE